MRHPYVWLLCRVAARSQRVPDPRPAAERRRQYTREITPTSTDGLAVRDHVLAVDGGQIRVRTYQPRSDVVLPAHLLLHGGGFWTGSVDTVDALARVYAARAECVVVSVDYRLAPEHPWPAAIEDAYLALRWTVAQAGEIGVDPERVSIGGVSAGGCIAAVVAMMARDRGGPALRFLLLEVPVTDLTASSPSLDRFATGYRTTKAELQECYDFYVPDASLRTAPYASPLLAPDLSGLPPACVQVCEYDLLRDEGEAFAQRLREAGVEVEVQLVKGHVHGSTYLTGLASARIAHERSAAALRMGLHGGARV